MNLLVNQFKADIERLVPQIHKRPEIGLSVLYALVLNNEKDRID